MLVVLQEYNILGITISGAKTVYSKPLWQISPHGVMSLLWELQHSFIGEAGTTLS
jgi:hypothetical protein